MSLATIVTSSTEHAATLPDVGAPPSLWLMALLGMMILLAGLAAMMLTRRH